MIEYRQDDETGTGYCPCGEPLSGLTVAGRGYCDRHGWTFADWIPPAVRMGDRCPGCHVVCADHNTEHRHDCPYIGALRLDDDERNDAP